MKFESILRKNISEEDKRKAKLAEIITKKVMQKLRLHEMAAQEGQGQNLAAFEAGEPEDGGPYVVIYDLSSSDEEGLPEIVGKGQVLPYTVGEFLDQLDWSGGARIVDIWAAPGMEQTVNNVLVDFALQNLSTTVPGHESSPKPGIYSELLKKHQKARTPNDELWIKSSILDANQPNIGGSVRESRKGPKKGQMPPWLKDKAKPPMAKSEKDEKHSKSKKEESKRPSGSVSRRRLGENASTSLERAISSKRADLIIGELEALLDDRSDDPDTAIDSVRSVWENSPGVESLPDNVLSAVEDWFDQYM